VFVDVLSDSRDQFFNIVKDATPEAVLCEIPGEALHHVQPRTAGRGEVNMESAMAGEPALYLRVFVRRSLSTIRWGSGWCDLIDYATGPLSPA
jgi:hypothetical protein